MAEYNVVEIFTSINGEGCKAGQLAVFVRFRGCNLACSFCDTAWANEADAPCTKMTEEDIVETIRKSGVRNVTLTGGEPLLQKDIQILLERLGEEREFSVLVEVETNGSMPLEPYEGKPWRPSMTMDYKLPGSGMENKMCLDNFAYLKDSDTVKFVCKNRADLERAAEIMEQYRLTDRCHVYMSPVFGDIDPEEMVEFMKEKKLNGVNLQLQLHKFIWSPEERGV